MSSPVVDRLLVVTPWWPSEDKPHAGSFVVSAAAAVRGSVGRIDVLHVKQRGYGRKERLLRPWSRDNGRATQTTGEGGIGLTRLPVAVPAGTGFAVAAGAAAARARQSFAGGESYDVVHAHTVLPGGAVARAIAPKAPLVVTEHASYLQRLLADESARRAYAAVVAEAAAVLCVGEQMRADLVAAFPDQADRFEVLPNVVDVPAPQPRGVDDDLSAWVSVGSLIERKRPGIVLDAFAALAGDHPDMRLTFVGSGPLDGELRARAAALGVADRVTLTGSVSHQQALQLIASAGVLVHLADHETFGMSVAEALGVGTPVIVTASAGPQEVLRGVERQAGELLAVDPSAVDVVDAWRRLLARHHELDRAATRRHILEQYGPAAVGERLSAVYARVQSREAHA